MTKDTAGTTSVTTASATTTTTTTTTSTLTLHDALALGQYEDAAAASASTGTTDVAEAHRLPLLLRLLSASRPRASLPDLAPRQEKDGGDASSAKRAEADDKSGTGKGEAATGKSDEDDTAASAEDTAKEDEEEESRDSVDDDNDEKDAWLDRVVQRLEDRAALYAAAEGVEVLAGHLAPHVCRKWSKLPAMVPRKTTRREDNAVVATVYDTTALAQAVGEGTASSSTPPRRRKLSDTSLAGLSSEEGNVLADYNRMEVDGDEEGGEEVDNDDDQQQHTTLDDAQRKKRRKQSSSQLLSSQGRVSVDVLMPPLRRQSTNTTATLAEREFAAEDSQQALATKSWTELALLVTRSLQQPLANTTTDDNSPPSPIALTVDEASILAQATSSSTTRGLMSADLSATLASLLPYTPVLRYDHVATALCRVGLPQAVDVCARLGANAPAAVPALVRGCLAVARATSGQRIVATAAVAADDAHQHSHSEDHHRSAQAAGTTAWASVKALAALSPYEGARASTVLRMHGTRSLKLELELAVERGDALGLALLVDEHLKVLDSSRRRHRSSLFDDEEDSLVTLLRDNEPLQATVCTCLGRDLAEQSRGRLEWILPSYLGILALGRAGPLLSLDWISRLWEKNPGARAFPHLLAIAWIGFCQSKASDIPQATENVRSCRKIITQLLEHGPAAFVMYMIGAWKGGADRLGQVILGILHHRESGTDACSATAVWLASTSNLESSAELLEGLPVEEILEKRMTEDAILEDPTSVAKLLSLPVPAIDEMTVRRTVGDFLKTTKARMVLKMPGTSPLLVAVNLFLSQLDMKERGLPLVLPLQMESMGLKAKSGLLRVSSSSAELPEEVAGLLLNLAYTLYFIRSQPESPFCTDIRSLPVYELFTSLESMSDDVVDPALRQLLQKGLKDLCEEVEQQSHTAQILQRSLEVRPSPFSANRTKQELTNAAREALNNPAKDPNGEEMEALYCGAFGVISQETLCCTLASAFLSTSLPLSVFPYAKLCMDPLTFLKCPLTCWDRPGIRRVLLMVLSHLFAVNDALIRSSPEAHEESAEELRISRNVLFVRCMVALMDKSPTMRSCSTTTSFIRSCVSQCPGTGAAVLRQGIEDAEVDWLVANVPEIMDCGNAYHSLLALQTIPTTHARLVAASAVLRICVVHGHRDEAKAQELALAAISVLISNFFIVIGPVGVPVSTFVGEEKGTDATQLCRRAALRMIKSISQVRGQRQGLRNECIMALQKLARLCKGEEIVGGLPSAMAGRQKGFLREMLDGISKALLALGSSL